MIPYLVGAGGFVVGFAAAAFLFARKIARLKLDVFFLELERDLRKGER